RRSGKAHHHHRGRTARAALVPHHALRRGHRHRPSAIPAVPTGVKGPYSRVYCGDGSLTACRAMLARTLKEALAVDPAVLYKDSVCSSSEGKGLDPQWCFDAIRQRPLGAVTQPLIEWVNRPTFQQADEIQGHR